MISGFLNQLARRNQAYTGKPGSSMYYDEKRKRYVIQGEEDEDDDEPPPPPPGVKKIIKTNENITDSSQDAPVQQEKQKEPEVAAGLNSLTAVVYGGALANRGRGRGGATAKAPVQSRFPQTFNPTQISNNSATPNVLEQEQKITPLQKNKDMPMQMNLDIRQSHQALYTTAMDISQSQILVPASDSDSNHLKQSVLITDAQDISTLDELTIQQQIEWEKLLQECEEMWQDKFLKQNERIKILKDRVKKYQEELTHSRQENEQTIDQFTQLCQDLKFRGMEEVDDLQGKLNILNQQCFLLSQDKAVLGFKNQRQFAKFQAVQNENLRLKNSLQKFQDEQGLVNVDQGIVVEYDFIEPLEYGNLGIEKSEEKSKLVSLVLELQIENDKLKWEMTLQRQNFIGQQIHIQQLNSKFEEIKNHQSEVDVKCKRLEKQLIEQASGYEDKIHEIQSQSHEQAFNSRQLLDRTAKERDEMKLILMDYQREQANDKAQNSQLTQKILLVQQQLAKKMENERILMSRAYQMRPFKTNRIKQKNQQKKIGSGHHSDDNMSDQIDGSSQNEDSDDSDTEFDDDEEFSSAEDSEGNQIEAQKIHFKLGVKQSEMHAKHSKVNSGVLNSQGIIQGDDASLRARKSLFPVNTEELQGKQADQNLIASDGITRDLKSSENAMQTETSIVGSHQSPTKQSLFDMIQKQIDNKITIEALSEQFDDEEYSHGRDDLVGNQIRDHLRKVSQQQKKEKNKRQTRKTMRQILKEQVEESRAQLKIDFEKRLQVERELHQQNHQLQLYKDGLSEIDGIIRGIMKSESINFVVKNRQQTLEEEVGDQQYNDNLSERNQTIVKNPLLEDEDEDEDVLGGSQSEQSKEDWDLSVETIINRIFEIQRHYQKDKTDINHQISVLNMKLESQDSIVLDLEILQHEKTLADQELIQFKNLLGQAQLQIRQIQSKFNDANEGASRTQIQLTTRDGEVDMLKKQVERLGQRNEQIRDQLDSKWELRVSELREHYEREIIPNIQTQAEKRFQSQLNRVQDQNNSMQEQYLDAERKLVQLQADSRQQKENLKMKENEKTQAQEESKLRELEKEELKNTLDNLNQTMFSDKRLQEQRLADCQSNLIQQQQFCSQLQSQISDMIEKRDQYKQQVKELTQQLAQQDLFFKQQIHQQEQVKIQQQDQFNQQLSQQDLYYKQQIQDYKETKTYLNQVLQQTQSENQQKDQLIQQKQSECLQYENEIKQLKIENSQKYSEQKQKEDESFWSLVRQVNQLKDENNQQAQSINQLNNLIKEKEQQLNQYTNQLQQFKQLKDENNQKSQQINMSNIVIKQIEQQMARQANLLLEFQEQIQSQKQQHEQEGEKWSKRLGQIVGELQRLRQENEVRGQQLEEKKQALDDAEFRIQELLQSQSYDTEKSQFQEIVQQGKTEIEQLQSQILVLQEQIVKLNQDQTIMSHKIQSAEESKNNLKTNERITEFEKLYEYQLQINDELNVRLDAQKLLQDELNDKNQRLKMMIAEKDKDIEILQNNQEESELRYIQNNNQEQQQVQEETTKKLFDDPEEVDVFAFYNNQEEVKEQPKNTMQWDNISSNQSIASQVPNTENQEMLQELQNKVQLLQDEIQDKNIKINELIQQLQKQQEMPNSMVEQMQQSHQQTLFQNEQKIKELKQQLQTLSQTRDELIVQLETQQAQFLQEIEQIKVQLMESQYQLQLQQAELETKHEEEVKLIKNTLGSELKKSIDLHEATNTQLLQLKQNQQNSDEISNMLQFDSLQQKIKEQEDIISSLKQQPIDNNREQSYKKAAEEMASKFKEKINKEKDKNKKLQDMNSSLNHELIKMKDEHSVQSLGYSQILDNLDQTRQDQSFKDIIYQTLAGLVDVKLEDSLENMIEKLNGILANFQEDKRQLQQLIQLNSVLSQENQQLKDKNYDLRYELQELGIKYQQSQDDLKQVIQKSAQLAEKDLIKETKPKEIAKEIKTKEIPKQTKVKQERDLLKEVSISRYDDMPLQVAKEQVQSSLFTSIASFFLTESEIQPKVEQPENEYEYYEYDDETDHAI